MSYLWLKSAHQLLALVSISGFILRWYWRMRASPLAKQRIVRTLPHVIDTLFLISGLTLAWKLTLLAALPAWLLAKIIGLLAYIILGAMAMRSAPRKPHSTIAFAAATGCFVWIVSVAIWRSPIGFFLFFPLP